MLNLSNGARLKLRMLISAFTPAGRPLVGLCRCAALSSLFWNGGWGGIACAALRPSRCARLELRSHPCRSFKLPCGRWRMGRDSNPRCIAAHTLSKRAQSTTLPPIRAQRELNTTGRRAARRQRSAGPADPTDRARCEQGSAAGRLPQLHEQEQGGDGGGGGEDDEEEVY